MPLNHDRLAGLKFDAQLPRDRNEIDTVREVDQLLDLAPLELYSVSLKRPNQPCTEAVSPRRPVRRESSNPEQMRLSGVPRHRKQ